MAADVSQGGPELPNWIVTLGASALTAAAGFILALINRSPALQAAVDARLQTLINAYEARIDDLSTEVHNLREEVVALRKALDAARQGQGFGGA
jgi:Skp family chaperone for outer membrane proteins